MIGTREFETWLEANMTALEIRDKWEVLEASELSPIVLKLRRQLDPFFDLFPNDWPRKQQLFRHVGEMCKALSSDHKEKCRSDIHDLLHADLPELFKHILKKCASLQTGSNET